MTELMEIEDSGLSDFIRNNTTERAREVYGIEVSDTVMIDENLYPDFVELYLKIRSMTSGRFDGKLDFQPNN